MQSTIVLFIEVSEYECFPVRPQWVPSSATQSIILSLDAFQQWHSAIQSIILSSLFTRMILCVALCCCWKAPSVTQYHSIFFQYQWTTKVEWYSVSHCPCWKAPYELAENNYKSMYMRIIHSIYIVARICNLHFQENCFEVKWTKPRAKNVLAKEIRRLKKNSVPSLLLHLEKKNKMKAK